MPYSEEIKIEVQSPEIAEEQKDDLIKSVDLDDLKKKSDQLKRMSTN